MTDAELLRRYAQDRSEAAFAELVARHVNLVFSVAVRQLDGNRQHAEDITQAVFADLARKARRLLDHPTLSGWLYTSTYYAAINLRRKEQRRQAREEASQLMLDNTPDPQAAIDWREIRPVLDAAMHRLSAGEREAIVLRYFEGRRFAEIGTMFGMSDDGARMRVERALDKLRVALGGHGITSSGVAIGALLANQAIAAAPQGLATSVAAAVAAGTSAGTGAAAGVSLASVLKIMATLSLKSAVLPAVVVALGAAIAVVHQTNARQQEELRRAQDAAARVVTLTNENARMAGELKQFDAWRGEEPLLAQRRAQAAAAVSGAPAAMGQSVPRVRPGMIPVSALGNRGNATPAATFETLFWAKAQHDLPALERLIVFDPVARAKSELFAAPSAEELANHPEATTPERLAIVRWMESRANVALQVDSQTDLDPDRVYLSARQQIGGGVGNLDLVIQRTSDGWQWVVGGSVQTALKLPANGAAASSAVVSP